jgi:hypothetical protein
VLAISRALYRKLVPRLLPESAAAGPDRRRRALLEAIEANLGRMVRDVDFSRPGRRLYLDIRSHFPLLDLPKVRQIIDSHMPLAEQRAQELRLQYLAGLERCQGLVRSGGPCSRPAIEGRRFCPSHKHLEEPLVEDLAPARPRQVPSRRHQQPARRVSSVS